MSMLEKHSFNHKRENVTNHEHGIARFSEERDTQWAIDSAVNLFGLKCFEEISKDRKEVILQHSSWCALAVTMIRH